MRIAITLERLEPARGGLEAYAAAWAAWLSGEGVAPVIVTLWPFQSESWPERPSGLEVRSLAGASGDVLVDAARLEAAARAGTDLVHDFGAGFGSDLFQPLFGLRASGQAGERRALGWRTIAQDLRRIRRRRALRALEARQIASRPLLVACSRRVAEDFRRVHGVAEAELRVLPNAVDSGRYRPADAAGRQAARAALGLPGEGTLFLQVAHNFRLKGVATAIRALARLKEQGLDARLAVAGRGPDPQPFARLAAGLGVGRCVHFLGALDETATAFRAADALLHPAYYDACSLVALEALAAGLPLAISVADGAAELVTDGVQGWLIRDPADAGEVAFQMKRLLDPGLRGAMAAQARVLALHNERAAAFRRLLGFAEEALRRRRG